MDDRSENIKRFLAHVYEDTLCRIYGDSLHPGGLNLTQRIGELSGITEETIVLDVASGTGASALALTKKFGCYVVGVDISRGLVRRSRLKIPQENLHGKLEFLVGDAELLPFRDSVFDVVLCECAFNLFPNKEKVISEIYRVLRGGGKFILADFTLAGDLPKVRRDRFSFAFCIAGAETLEKLVKWMERAGFTDIYIEDHTDKLLPFGIQLLLNPNDFVLENLDALEELFQENLFNYVLIVASKPSG